MRIFQGIVEIAGQIGTLTGALKKLGYHAVGYNTFHSYLGYHEHLINTDAVAIRNNFRQILNSYDVFHFHYGTTIFPDYRDLKILRKKGKKIIMHHWGNDVRFHDLARLNNPYVYTGDSPPNEEIKQKLQILSQYISDAIVQDYEVYTYVKPHYKRVHVLPLAIDLSKFKPYYPEITKKRPLILHAPTNPDFKGTAYIEAAIQKLKRKYQFAYKRIEKMPNAQVIRLYQKADIIIDQILCGSYGLLSVESMALGKPVITYIRPDLVSTFPKSLPIVSANPDNIYDAIKILLERPELRFKLGVRGRRYVRKYHAGKVVAKKLINIYNSLQPGGY